MQIYNNDPTFAKATVDKTKNNKNDKSYNNRRYRHISLAIR